MKSIFMFLFGAGVVAGFVSFFTLGYDRGLKEVVAACTYYNKYAVDGTVGLHCTVNPDPLTIKIVDTNAGKKPNKNWK